MLCMVRVTEKWVNVWNDEVCILKYRKIVWVLHKCKRKCYWEEIHSLLLKHFAWGNLFVLLSMLNHSNFKYNLIQAETLKEVCMSYREVHFPPAHRTDFYILDNTCIPERFQEFESFCMYTSVNYLLSLHSREILYYFWLMF